MIDKHTVHMDEARNRYVLVGLSAYSLPREDNATETSRGRL